MLQAGIVGLPNVGKSTLFNALTRSRNAEAANYPFCTIEPNVGIVEVPDERLAPLAKIAKTNVIVPAVIEFVDIAGLVAGASKGEGSATNFCPTFAKWTPSCTLFAVLTTTMSSTTWEASIPCATSKSSRRSSCLPICNLAKRSSIEI